MKSVYFPEIKISKTRQRREFDADSLVKLAEGIRTKGLMHPPVVRTVTDPHDIEHGTYITLVAGERRMRAMQLLHSQGEAFSCDGQQVPVGMCPITFVEDMDDLAAWEAELEENVLRQDLTWQERAQAESALHDLRTKQAEAKGETHTIRQTVDEIAGPQAATTQVQANIVLAKNMHRPEVAKAKTAGEAYKIIKKTDQQAQNAKVAAVVGETFSVASHTLVNKDSLEWMKTLPANLIDIVLTDPPYGMDADEFGDAGGALASNTHVYKDDDETFKTIMATLPRESYRLAKPQAHLYCFCDIDNFAYMRLKFAEAGWRVHRTPIIWHKPRSHRVPWPSMGPRRHWEAVLYAVKGDRPVQYIGPDVIAANSDENLGHPAQKPTDLLVELLNRSGIAGSTVLDPFMGTGSTVLAAHLAKMTCYASELSPSHYGLAVQRLRELK